MTSPVGRRPFTYLQNARIGLMLAGAVALGGCSMAGSSDLLDPEAGACTASAGGYYLARSHLKVSVSADRKGRIILDDVSVAPKADRSSGYCLSFIASGTSRDTFVVQKDPNEHLLLKISSKAEDRSTEIANTLVQTVFKALEAEAAWADFRSGNTDAAPQLTKVFDAEFDPFNPAQTDVINDGLKNFGLCLILDRGDGQWTNFARGYCDNPLGGQTRARALGDASVLTNKGTRIAGRFQAADGVLYRPRLPYTLYLMQNRRADRRGPGDWRIWQSSQVYLENRSPVLSIGVNRTYFATRKTTLLFSMGALQDVYIEKDSEIANAATIPLNIAQGIAALPSKVVQVRFDVTSRREELIRAQDQLIEAERRLAEARKAQREAEGLVKPDAEAGDNGNRSERGRGGVTSTDPVPVAGSVMRPLNGTGANGQCSDAAMRQCMARGASQSMCLAVGCSN